MKILFRFSRTYLILIVKYEIDQHQTKHIFEISELKITKNNNKKHKIREKKIYFFSREKRLLPAENQWEKSRSNKEKVLTCLDRWPKPFNSNCNNDGYTEKRHFSKDRTIN